MKFFITYIMLLFLITRDIYMQKIYFSLRILNRYFDYLEKGVCFSKGCLFGVLVSNIWEKSGMVALII